MDNPIKPEEQQSFDANTFALQILLIVSVSLLIYATSVTNMFAFDDNNQIVTNSWIRSANHLKEIFTQNVAGFDRRFTSNYYRPMMYVVFMANYKMFGLQPWSYHIINIIIHSLSAVIIFLIAAYLIPQRNGKWNLPAMLAGLIFATHPIHTEAVMWISALPDIATTFLCLCSLYLYILSKKPFHSTRRYIVSLATFFLALLFKEIAITLPVLIVVYDIIYGKIKELPYKKYIPYIILTSIYAILRLNALKAMAPSIRFTDLTVNQYIYNSIVFFAEYLKTTLWPADLNVFHLFIPAKEIDIKVIFATVITIMFISSLFLFRKYKRVVFCLAIFLIPLLPALYLPALGESPFAERYLYLPLAGFSLMAGIIFNRAMSSGLKKISYILTAIAVAFYILAVIQRAPDWKNDLTLFTSSLKYSSGSATVHKYLAQAYYQEKRMEDAIQEYTKAISLDPTDPYSHLNLGVAYQSGGMVESAIWQYMIAISIKPNLYEAFSNIGTAYASRGLLDLGLENCETALKIFADDAAAHECKGTIYGNLREMDKAIPEFQTALLLMPENSTYQANLQKAYRIKSEQSAQ